MNLCALNSFDSFIKTFKKIIGLYQPCDLYPDLAQSRLCALHSCETALTRLVDMWTANMGKCLPMVLFYRT